jgi:CheY-like chemotaxis protein
MNGVLGMIEMTLDTELTPEQREYLAMAKTSADDLLRVINDLLDFSKIEAGKLDLDPIFFNLRERLPQTMKPLAWGADQKGLELTCDIRPEVPEEIFADPSRLRQILVNLVGNAIKFTERGEVGLEVGVESPGEEKVRLHFAVRDTGVGIAPEKQKLIFEAFAQADGSTTRTFGGTGLGLTISSRLVEMMGGQIGVESRLGEGSRFHFSIPVRVAKATTPQAMQRKDLEGLPVLVVDDNFTNRRILGDILMRWGMRPTLASSGRAALARLEESRRSGDSFALLLTDANMPEMDGFAFVEQIRQQVDLANTTIMMLTSARKGEDWARCRELGIVAYLVKPVSQSELLDAILRVLGTRAAVREETPSFSRHSLGQRQFSLRVLLAEDNPVNQKLASRLMQKWGHRVVVVENGREALKALERRTFDVVVMDVSMPEMDGFEAAAAIRAKERANGLHLPIIAMTAHAMKGDRERCLAAGMDGYISKPVQPKELLEALESVLPAAVLSGRPCSG